MRRNIRYVVAILLGALAAVLAIQRPGSGAPVYAPDQVKDGLMRHPTAWDGRIVLVQGILIDTHHLFPQTRARVVDPPVFLVPLPPPRLQYVTSPAARRDVYLAIDPRYTLTLHTVPPDPVISFLRHLLVVGRLFAPPQQGDALRGRVYRVQLAAASHTCTGLHPPPGCYDAILDDYQP